VRDLSLVIDLRGEVRPRDPRPRPVLLDASHRDAEIEVVAERLVDERFQRVVTEEIKPGPVSE